MRTVILFISALGFVGAGQPARAVEFDPAAAQEARLYFGTQVPASQRDVLAAREYQYMAALNRRLREKYGIFELAIPAPLMLDHLEGKGPKAKILLSVLTFSGGGDHALVQREATMLLRRLKPLTGAYGSAMTPLARELIRAGIYKAQVTRSDVGPDSVDVAVEFLCSRDCTASELARLGKLNGPGLLGDFTDGLQLVPGEEPTYLPEGTDPKSFWRVRPLTTNKEHASFAFRDLADYAADPKLLEAFRETNFYQSSGVVFAHPEGLAEGASLLEAPIGVAVVLAGGDCMAGCNVHYVWLARAMPTWSGGSVTFTIDGIESNLTDWLGAEQALKQVLRDPKELELVQSRPMRKI